MKRLFKSLAMTGLLIAVSATIANAMIVGADKIQTSKGVITESQLYNSTTSTMYSVTLSPATVSANTTSTMSATITGLKTTYQVIVFKPTHQLGIFVAGATVKAANTLWLAIGNASSSAIVPTASESYKVFAICN